MKAKDITRIVGSSLKHIVAGILFAGCVTNQSHPNSDPPSKQVAILKTRHSFFDSEDCWITNVDGFEGKRIINNPLFGKHPTGFRIELFPGEHTVTFQYSKAGQENALYRLSYTGSPITKHISVEAGKTYNFVPWTSRSGWRVEITEER
jgi:hypothetical protein